jgi:hypothetical protein
VAEADDAMRERLDDTLHDALCQCRPDNQFGITLRSRDLDAAMDALLPTVRAIAAERAAAELRRLADGIGDWPGVGNLIRGQLQDAADALDPR